MTRVSGLAGSMRRMGEPFVTVDAPELASMLGAGSPGFGADVRNTTQGTDIGRLILVHDLDDPDFRWLATGAEDAIASISVGDRLELDEPDGDPIVVTVAVGW